ncbi:MAG: hypothetical protein FJZ94_06995 [Chloroflexi bacterium]|nr:hypothetical protein [Chloroflexota bacterium]MBM3167172.1 hypothetical protein [Chloroflexota bacterium]MBM4451452.1 hypothetical protein [Chloroflexota bacterium]MBM4453191.1 hypothetical protein [Chloroflexota bacterium]
MAFSTAWPYNRFSIPSPCISNNLTMAMVTTRPDRFIGMHWFNPPQLMRGTEVITADRTSQETLNTLSALCKRLNKEPGICKDSPGLIVNRPLQIMV